MVMNSASSNMRGARRKQHRHESSVTARPSSSSQPQQQQQQQHSAKLKYRYVNKSTLTSSSSSSSNNPVAVEWVHPEDDVVDATRRNHEKHNTDDVIGNTNAVVDESETRNNVAGSSEVKEGDDGGEIDIMGRLDKLLSDIREPQLSEEQITFNDQLQQDEVITGHVGLNLL